MSQQARLGSVSWDPDIRMANPPPALLTKYTRKEKDFFYDYASFVLRIITHQMVSGRIEGIVKAEALRFVRPVDIRVMVFPARTFPGRANRVLHGSYSRAVSQISLYPLKIPRELIRGEGLDLFSSPFEILSERKKKLLYEISENAIATLVHELLHVKFEQREMNSYGEEALVRKLEKQYMAGWEDTILEAIRMTRAVTAVSDLDQDQNS